MLGLTDGNLLIAARRGDPTPIGGTFGSMDAWPADKRQHRHPQRRDTWRPKRRAQRAYGFQSLPKRTPTPTPTATLHNADSYTEFHSYADGEPAPPHAKSDSDPPPGPGPTPRPRPAA